jgi:hypothetical protein
MRRVDDDDVVAAIDMGRVRREVFAAEAHRDQGGEPADHQTFGVDQHPLLRHLGGLCRKRFHVRKSVKGGAAHQRRTAGFLDKRAARVNAARRELSSEKQQLMNMVLCYLKKHQVFGME